MATIMPAVARTLSHVYPADARVNKRLLVGRLQRIFIKPWVFTISAFPILWVASLMDANPDVYLWEDIRSLDPLPDAYAERFPNVQAVIGLAALEQLDEWTSQTQRHAELMNRSLAGLNGVRVPRTPPGRTHVYYQYCLYGTDRDQLVVGCVKRGVDIETLHVDVCPDSREDHGERKPSVNQYTHFSRPTAGDLTPA